MNNSFYRLRDLVSKNNTKYSIENVSKAYFYLNEPLKNIKVIHIAGTNGKGSVSYKVAKALTYSGYKVGLFTSPHISTIRERIMVDFNIISEVDFEVELGLLFDTLDALEISLSFFEVLTLLAFSSFKKKNVDFAVVEVGLGGRLDATNVIYSNINVITSIGYDHQYLLGDTLDKIAEEKAGIIKSNAPTVLGPNAFYPSIFKRADKFFSPIYKVTKNSLNYDEENQHTAEVVLSLLKDNFSIAKSSIENGVKERPHCRFEIFEQSKVKDSLLKNVILDVAHNIDGLKRLKEMLDQKFNIDKYIVILGISKDKDINEFCKYLLNFAKEIHLAESNHPRLMSPQKISDLIPNDVPYLIHQSFYDAMQALAKRKDEYVLVLGSFYFMSDIKKALNGKQACDRCFFSDPVLKPS